MQIDTLTAVSPIDGRYAGKCRELGDIFSEYGLIRRRVLVECRWLEALCDAGEIDLTDVDPLTFEAWSLGDGTQILMITDAKDDEADVVFYQPPIAQ